jgi:hypothetical protein
MANVYRFRCPKCDHSIGVRLEPESEDSMFMRPLTNEEKEAGWLERAPEIVQRLFIDLEAAGLLGAFRNAVNMLPMASRPSNVYRFFLNFMRTAGPFTLRQAALLRLGREFTGGRIQVYAAQGIVMVTSGDSICAIAHQSVIEQLAPTALIAKQVAQPVTDSWIKTRFGYVTGSLLYGELQRRSLGAFDEMTKRPG